MSETTQLWQLIDAWRDRQRFRPSQAQVAKEIGVQSTALSQWKLGKARPSPDNLRSIAAVTGIAYSDLLAALNVDTGYLPVETIGGQQWATGTPGPEDDSDDGGEVVDLPQAAREQSPEMKARKAAEADQWDDMTGSQDE